METLEPPVALERYSFSISTFEKLFRAGVLGEDERVELINGEIIRMSPLGQQHMGAVIILSDTLKDVLGKQVVVSTQNALELNISTMPQPDIVVLKPPALQYRHKRPTPEDVLLLVEVADSSLAYDRRVKLPLFAEAGIAEVWIVNLVETVLEVYRNPSGGRYLSQQIVPEGEGVTPLAFPDVTLPWL